MSEMSSPHGVVLIGDHAPRFVVWQINILIQVLAPHDVVGSIDAAVVVVIAQYSWNGPDDGNVVDAHLRRVVKELSEGIDRDSNVGEESVYRATGLDAGDFPQIVVIQRVLVAEDIGVQCVPLA